VTDLSKRIEDTKKKAAESDLLARHSADEEARLYNRSLSVELWAYARKLRSKLANAAGSMRAA
jgi:hypothetical protein